MKKAIATLSHAALVCTIILPVVAGCLATRPAQTPATPRPQWVKVTYQDNVSDSLLTTYDYERNTLIYVHECSCDGVITALQ